MRIQFDLQYYLEHPETKVVTRDGKSVRVICTDARSAFSYNIVCLVPDDRGDDLVYKFMKDGKFIENQEYDYDLFFDIPGEIKKVPLTYEDLVQRIEAGKTMWVQLEYVPGCYNAFNIISFNHIGIKYEGGPMRYNDLANNRFTFINGDPCWKEVEE